MLRNTFRFTPNLFGSTRYFSDAVSFILWLLRWFRKGLRFHRALKCVTLRFENTPVMTEMRLRSIIISGTWMPIMTAVHSGYKNRLDLTSYNIPFFIDTGLVWDSIHDILCLVQPRYRKILIHSFRDIHPCDLVTRCAVLWMQSQRVGPQYLSITWIDKSRSWIKTAQHISMEYPRYTFMASIF